MLGLLPGNLLIYGNILSYIIIFSAKLILQNLDTIKKINQAKYLTMQNII